MQDLPRGTVTMLFTDIEGSTRLVQRLGEKYGGVLADCRHVLRAVVGEAGGHEVDCRADELFAVFERSRDALTAAVQAQRALQGHAWPDGVRVRVRMGLHTGEPAREGGSYVGLDVNRAARVSAAGHGGQILCSRTTRDLLASDFELRDLGLYHLHGLVEPERIYQLVVDGLRSEFPPLQAREPRSGRFRGLSRHREKRPASLAEQAWRVRATIPRASPEFRAGLSELGASLFAADRAVARADALLARIDRRRLGRRLDTQRDMSLVSQHAREEVESLERRLVAVDRLVAQRGELAELAAELPVNVDLLQADCDAGLLAQRVAAATERLDDAAFRAATTLDPLSFKLTHTRHRGVFVSGGHYVVPYTDTLGADRLREFETAVQAQQFRDGLRLAHKAQHEYTGPSYRGGEWHR